MCMEIATKTGVVSFETTWETNNGDKVSIKDMEDSHLLNAVHFLEERMRGETTSTDSRLRGQVLPAVEHNRNVLLNELLSRSETGN